MVDSRAGGSRGVVGSGGVVGWRGGDSGGVELLAVLGVGVRCAVEVSGWWGWGSVE